MFRASDIFGRNAGSAVSRPSAQAKADGATAPLGKRSASDVPKNRVWDPATGVFVEEEIPVDLQELLGFHRKRAKMEPEEGGVWDRTSRVLGPASVGLGARVKTEHAAPVRSPVGTIDRTNASVEFLGFGKVEINDCYYEKPEIQLHGKTTYWTPDGLFFIYWQGEVQRWAICDGSSLPAVRAGQYPGWAYKHDHKHFSQGPGWLEAFGGEWQEPEIQVHFKSASHHTPQWNDAQLQQAVSQITFHGFSMRELNTTYHLKAGQNLQGRPSYWDNSGVYFIYWQQQMNRWAICDLKCLDAVKQNQCPGWAYRSDSKHFANASGWTESRSEEWSAAIIETTVTSTCSRGLKVQFNGFAKSELNTQYVEKSSEVIQGKPSFWDPTDTFFIYWQASMSRWAICDFVSLGAAKQGQTPGWTYRCDSKHFTGSGGWLENWGRDWRQASPKCRILEGAVRELPAAVKAEPGAPAEAQLLQYSVEQYRELVEKAYNEKNPTKLSEVDNLMEKWSGRENLLFQNICDKYDVDADAFIAENLGEVGVAAAVGAEADEYGALEEADVPELDAYQYASHVQSIYERYNSKKLADLARLLQKYRNRERELYFEVCKKYDVHPAKFYYKRLKEEGSMPTKGASITKRELVKSEN